MQEIPIKKVINCPVCGGKVKLMRNASKDFQVRCPKCGARTGWMRKTDAVIEWYNLCFAYMRNKEKA